MSISLLSMLALADSSKEKPRRTVRPDYSIPDNPYSSGPYGIPTKYNDLQGPHQNPGQYGTNSGGLDYRTPSSFDHSGGDPHPFQPHQTPGLAPLPGFSTTSRYPSSVPTVDYNSYGSGATSQYPNPYASPQPRSSFVDHGPPSYQPQDSYTNYPSQAQVNQGQYPRQGRGSPDYEPREPRGSGSHSASLYECPERRCERKGSNALKGKDNLNDHLRKVHGKALRTK